MTTALLCHFDGTNGQTTTVDSSPGAHSMTFGGGAVLSTTSPKFGTASFDNTSGGYCQSADSADWDFGSGQFTVEGWVYYTSAPGSNSWGFVTQWGGFGGALAWYFGHFSGALRFYYSTTGSDAPFVGAAWTPSLNTWYHLAVDRDASNVLRIYIDGSVHASATVSATIFNAAQLLCIGNDLNYSRALIGRIDEVRITKGAAIYGGAFTPPSAPFNGVAVSQTQFVICTREKPPGDAQGPTRYPTPTSGVARPNTADGMRRMGGQWGTPRRPRARAGPSTEAATCGSNDRGKTLVPALFS